MTISRWLETHRAAWDPVARLPAPHAGIVRAGNRLYLSAQSAVDGGGAVVGAGDPGAQAAQAMATIARHLEAAGASLADVCKLTTVLVDRDHRKPVYEAIARALGDTRPCSTGLIGSGLARPELMVQIDAEAVIASPGVPHVRSRPVDLPNWFGQQIAWKGCMVVVTPDEIFVRGQTGSALDGTRMVGLGRTPQDAADQADLALRNLLELLAQAGSSKDEICKLTVYVPDRAYREAVYPQIGRHLAGVHPVSTGLVVQGFARPEILFEIDVVVARSSVSPHQRLRKYHSSMARYGKAGQKLDCEFCMAVRAGNRVYLRGQTGVALDHTLIGAGDAAAQTEQAMRNVAILLGDAGARLDDVVKATLYVTDRAYLAASSAVVARHLAVARSAFSSVIVKGLASPDLLVEVDVTAVIPEDRA